MRHLFKKDVAVRIIQLLDFVKTKWILGDEGAFAEQIGQIGQTMLLRKVVDVGKKLLFGDANKRIADSGTVSRDWITEAPCTTYSPVSLAVKVVMLFLRISSLSKMEPRRGLGSCSWCWTGLGSKELDKRR